MLIEILTLAISFPYAYLCWEVIAAKKDTLLFLTTRLECLLAFGQLTARFAFFSTGTLIIIKKLKI